jgi:hypothetical protein
MKAKLSYKEVLQSDPFASGANLDLSGYPDYSEKPTAKPDPFAPRIAEFSSDQLKSFAADPGRDVLEEIAIATRNPELLAQVQDEKEGIEAEKFVANNPQYYQSEENSEALRVYLDEKNLRFNEQNLTLAFKNLTKAGALQVKPGQARPLTPDEELRCARLCQQGFLPTALEYYARCRLSLTDSDANLDVAAMPEYSDVMDEAARFLFYQTRADVTPSLEFEAYALRYLAGRPASLPLLANAWSEFKKQESKLERGLLVQSWRQPESKPSTDPLTISKSFDEMSDDQIERTLRASYREHFSQASEKR